MSRQIDQLIADLAPQIKAGKFIGADVRRYGVYVDFGELIARKIGKAGLNQLNEIDQGIELLINGQIISQATIRALQNNLDHLRKQIKHHASSDLNFARLDTELSTRSLTLDFFNQRVLGGSIFSPEVIKLATKSTSKLAAQTELDSVLDVFTSFLKSEDRLLRAWTDTLLHLRPGSKALNSAANKALTAAPDVDKLLRSNLDIVAKRQQIWGHISGIQGLLGEGYAIAHPLWRQHLSEQLKLASDFVRKDGNRYAVHYITQLDNKLLLNGKEGPDAVILLIDRARGNCVLFSQLQVKTKRVSDATEQTIGDIKRRAGLQASASGQHSFQFIPDGKTNPETFSIIVDPRVSKHEKLFTATFEGSRTPKASIEELNRSALEVVEIRLGRSVSEMSTFAFRMTVAAIEKTNR